MVSLQLLCLAAISLLVFAIVFLFAISSRMPAAEFYARTLISWITLVICACYGVGASICLRLVGYSGLSQWTVARSFKWTMRYTAGVRFIIEDEMYLTMRPAVFIGNHQTELDILMLGTVFPPYCSVTAKKSLKWVPFLGWFMALSKTVFIDRSNRQNARAAFDGAARTMKEERQSVFIFPEGTRSYTAEAELLPFKKGAFHLAIQAKVPIVPIVVANYSNILHIQSRLFRPGNIPIKVLPPISTDDLSASDVDRLVLDTRDQMLKELVKLTETNRAQGSATAMSSAHVTSENESGRNKKD